MWNAVPFLHTYQRSRINLPAMDFLGQMSAQDAGAHHDWNDQPMQLFGTYSDVFYLQWATTWTGRIDLVARVRSEVRIDAEDSLQKGFASWLLLR